MKKTETINNGISFISLLALLLIALKIMGYIKWSWWWVLAPIWIQWLIVLIVLAIVGIKDYLMKKSFKKR